MEAVEKPKMLNLGKLESGLVDEIENRILAAIVELQNDLYRLRQEDFVSLSLGHLEPVKDIVGNEVSLVAVSMDVHTDLFSDIECPTDFKCPECDEKLFVTPADFVAVKVCKTPEGDYITGIKGIAICGTSLVEDCNCEGAIAFEYSNGEWMILYEPVSCAENNTSENQCEASQVMPAGAACAEENTLNDQCDSAPFMQTGAACD